METNGHRTQENSTYYVNYFSQKFISDQAFWEKWGAKASYPAKCPLKLIILLLCCLSFGGEHPKHPVYPPLEVAILHEDLDRDVGLSIILYYKNSIT